MYLIFVYFLLDFCKHEHTYTYTRISKISALLFKASQGDIGHAVGLLTTQPAEVQDPGEPQESGTSGETWEGQKGTLRTNQTFTKILATTTLFEALKHTEACLLK